MGSAPRPVAFGAYGLETPKQDKKEVILLIYNKFNADDCKVQPAKLQHSKSEICGKSLLQEWLIL